MTNFKFTFTNPWLLLLLIPAMFITLFPYFRLAKKYRRNRNRITSIVLHSLICLFAVCVLAGLAFEYDVPNNRNEVLLLVDVSDSGEASESKKNEFVRAVLDENESKFRVGVVAFGYNQLYAASLSNDTNKLYDTYLDAVEEARAEGTLNATATDISAALTYARTLFEMPETAKIVLVSDGLETDGSAMNVIRSIASDGIKVDTVHFPTAEHESEVQVLGIAMPDYNVAEGDAVTLAVNLNSSYAVTAQITLYDNDVAGDSTDFELKEGMQSVTLNHRFEGGGLHKLKVRIVAGDDELAENNEYNSYFFINVFDKVLIIENRENESDMLKDVLDKEKGGSYEVNTVCIGNASEVPSTVDALREYDQVILLNISNADLQTIDGLDTALETYVSQIGGGLFTVGGEKSDGSANVYDRNDMIGTTYQGMLPVNAIDYTPPLGVVILIDHSGSMNESEADAGKSRLELAKEGALSALGVLTERDYCGVMVFAQEVDTVIDPTPAPQAKRIRAAIDKIGSEDDNFDIGSDGTVFTSAIIKAGTQLRALNVQKRHVILVTDGDPGDSLEQYGAAIDNNLLSGITISIVCTGDAHSTEMATAAERGGGRYYDVSASGLAFTMRNDLNIPEIKDYNPEPFTPVVENSAQGIITGDLVGAKIPELGGFYGVKAKEGATVVLRSEYTPVYAQWKYGEGMVGSFMCDLEGIWSRGFMEDTVGVKLIDNIVHTLMPTHDIRFKDIDVGVSEDNYKTQLSIYTSLGEKEKLSVTVTAPDGNELQSNTFGSTDNYSRVAFSNLEPGIYEITAVKTDEAGNVISSFVTYKSFSYSEEYNAFVDEKTGVEFMRALAENGRGEVIDAEEPWSVFEEVVKTLHKKSDPRLAFLIIIIVLFLLDIAARKFKFKWPHEIVRDYKAKKELKEHKA